MTKSKHHNVPPSQRVLRAAVISFECAYNPKPVASDEERDRHWRSVCEIGWQVVDIGPARKVRLLCATGGTKLLELMADEPDATFDMLAAEMPPPRPPKTSN